MLEVAETQLEISGSEREHSGEEVDGRDVGGAREGEDLAEVVLVSLLEAVEVGGSEDDAGGVRGRRIEKTFAEGSLLCCCESSEVLTLAVDPVGCEFPWWMSRAK